MPPVPELQCLTAQASDVGGVPLRRALPHRQRRTVGAWCFLDHAGPSRFAPGQGMHVGPHPHIGLQTFTWMIEGALMHRDSLGTEQCIQAGQVNLMTAGRGISHSEDQVGDGTLHAAQFWIALPDGQRHCAPAFEHHAELPSCQLGEAGGLALTLLVGEWRGLRSPVTVYSPLLCLDLVSRSADQATLALPPAHEHAALVLRGTAHVADQALQPGTLLYLGGGREAVTVALGEDSQLLLLGGEPLAQPPLLWWNFVARTQAEMAEALADWQQGGERFGLVHGSGAKPLSAPSLAGMQLKVAGAG